MKKQQRLEVESEITQVEELPGGGAVITYAIPKGRIFCGEELPATTAQVALTAEEVKMESSLLMR